jgi:hypothetical protein
MDQQDKISILGPREDGTYVVEFRTAEGKKLAITVPSTKAAVLKHFQAATAELHQPTPDEGAMIGIQKPEIRKVLKIGWTVARGILELAIMVYVLGAILDPADTVIVAFSALSMRRSAARPCFNISRSRKWLGQVTVNPWSSRSALGKIQMSIARLPILMLRCLVS